jgi:hypothetical protein
VLCDVSHSCCVKVEVRCEVEEKISEVQMRKWDFQLRSIESLVRQRRQLNYAEPIRLRRSVN